MRVDHPDVMSFITCKENEGDISNFNISVALTDAFMNALEQNQPFYFKHPKLTDTIQADSKEIFDAIIDGMWRNGEPGVQFLDTVNRVSGYNARYAEANTNIETSNPCSEAFLQPHESCILASINLYAFVTPFWKGKPTINFEALKDVVIQGVKFLNRIVDVTLAPLPQIDAQTRKTRKIGLGVMGLADMLSALAVSYNSSQGRKIAFDVMKFITEEAEKVSLSNDYKNAMITLVAPTGTVSTVADCSSGIEPHFRPYYHRESVKIGKFKVLCRSLNDFVTEALDETDRVAILKYLDDSDGKFGDNDPMLKCFLPASLSEIWPSADQIKAMDHIRMAADIQANVHNGVSKTINLPNSATKEDIRPLIFAAWKAGLKGFTVYRDGSRTVQVLTEIKAAAPASCDKCNDGICPMPQKPKEPQTVSITKMEDANECGKIYATAVLKGDKLEHVFFNHGGGWSHGANCVHRNDMVVRLLSECMKHGVPTEKISELMFMYGPESTQEEPHYCADRVRLLVTSMMGTVKQLTSPESMDKCPKCSFNMTVTGACKTCHACGYSTC